MTNERWTSPRIREIGIIRAGGDLQVALTEETNRYGAVVNVKAYDSDGNHLSDLASFSADNRDLLIAVLPTTIELARDRYKGGRVGSCDWTRWTSRETPTEWMGNDSVDQDLDRDVGRVTTEAATPEWVDPDSEGLWEIRFWEDSGISGAGWRTHEFVNRGTELEWWLVKYRLANPDAEPATWALFDEENRKLESKVESETEE